MHPEAAPGESAEREAAKAGVNYVRFEGAIGCLTEGAAAAAAMRAHLEALGGRPSVLIDIEGVSDERTVGRAIALLLNDADVKVAWLSLRGDAARCGLAARALLAALRERRQQAPIVVSLQGLAAEAARQLLNSGPMTLMLEPELERAARLAVASSGVPAPRRRGNQPQEE